MTFCFLKRILQLKLIIQMKKDYDEDGWIMESSESWRLVRANDEIMQEPITSESEDRKQ